MPQSVSTINYRLGSLYSVITAFLYATQEPFSFPAATHLSTLQFVCLTQVSLLISIPLLTAQPASRRDFIALFRKPANYGYLAVIFAIGMSGLLLYNLGLSNAHPIIISAILNLSPFWAALVALIISRVPIPISPATFFGCFTGAFIGAMAVAWSQLSGANKPTFDVLADNFVHGSWVYAIPVPLCSALGGTLVGKWFAKYNESAAIAANFLFANVILIPSSLVILYLQDQLNFDQLQAIVLMIVGTILASSVGTGFLSGLTHRHRRRQRFRRDVLEPGPGADRAGVAHPVAVDRRRAFRHQPDICCRVVGDRLGAAPVFARVLATACPAELNLNARNGAARED